MGARPSLAVVVALLAAASPAAAADRCNPHGSETLEQNASVRVFEVKHRHSSVVFGCLRRRGRPVRLIRNIDEGGLTSTAVSQVVVRGTSLAVVQGGFVDLGVEGEEFENIIVYDLAPGGRRFRRNVSENDDELYDAVTNIVLRRDGAAAWAIAADRYTEIDTLGAHTRRPTPVVFAKGISAASLALSATEVSWTQDGVRRTAPAP